MAGDQPELPQPLQKRAPWAQAAHHHPARGQEGRLPRDISGLPWLVLVSLGIVGTGRPVCTDEDQGDVLVRLQAPELCQVLSSSHRLTIHNSGNTMFSVRMDRGPS